MRLPRSLGARTIPRDRLDATVRRVLPSLERIERLLTPRLALMFSPVGDRATAVACLALSVLLFLPIPFTSIAPAIVLTVIAFGLLQRDGAAVLVGWIGLAGLLTAFIAMFGALMTATRAFCGTVLGG